MDDRDEVNRVLAEMGEPPLGPDERVQSVVHGSVNDPDKQIALVDPAGYRRSALVLMNGRRVILDMQLEDLVGAVRDFLMHPELDFLELPSIDVVGEDAATAVIFRNPQQFSRKAIELVQSMGVFWTKHVPGRKMTDGAPDPAVQNLRQDAATAKKYKVLGLVKR